MAQLFSLGHIELLDFAEPPFVAELELVRRFRFGSYRRLFWFWLRLLTRQKILSHLIVEHFGSPDLFEL